MDSTMIILLIGLVAGGIAFLVMSLSKKNGEKE